jgi:hypothetical protein
LFPPVQLEHESRVVLQAFVVGATVRARDAQELLIPSTAGFDVRDTDEWLRLHCS